MLNILALASTILQPIFSLYPSVNFHSKSCYTELFCQDYGEVMSQHLKSTISKFCGQESKGLTFTLDHVLTQIILYFLCPGLTIIVDPQ